MAIQIRRWCQKIAFNLKEFLCANRLKTGYFEETKRWMSDLKYALCKIHPYKNKKDRCDIEVEWDTRVYDTCIHISSLMCRLFF